MAKLQGYRGASKWKVVVGDRTYDSKKEAGVAQQLQWREHAREIHGLRYQVRFDIVINDIKVCTYIADFTYKDESGREVVVDAKSDYSRKDKVYRLKKKLMHAVYGITIQEL